METRICKICRIEKPLKSFPTRRASKNDTRLYHRHDCNTCRSNRYKDTENGRKKIRLTAQRSQQRYRENKDTLKMKLLESIGQTSCKDCGFSNISALSFHHRDPSEKKFNISWGFTHNYGFDSLLEEAKKCDAICENCHSLKHFIGKTRAQKYRLQNKCRLLKDIDQETCKGCGCSHPICLSFHHINPETKSFEIKSILSNSGKYESMLSEARKCDVLCRNCHFIFHQQGSLEGIEQCANKWIFIGDKTVPKLPPKTFIEPSNKRCNYCKIEKPIHSFPKRGEPRKDGSFARRNRCNTCVSKLCHSR